MYPFPSDRTVPMVHPMSAEGRAEGSGYYDGLVGDGAEAGSEYVFLLAPQAGSPRLCRMDLCRGPVPCLTSQSARVLTRG